MSTEWKEFIPTGTTKNGRSIYDVQVQVDGRETHFRHPSFGIIRAARWYGNQKNRLFQSNTDLNSGVSITISRAELKRDLSNDWLYDYDELIEVNLSPAQFADLLVNMNTQGVPCTISHLRNGKKFDAPEFPADFDNELRRIEREFKEAIQELETMNVADVEEVKEIISRLPKKDQGRMIAVLDRITSKVKSNIPFIRDQFEESVERTITQAKHEMANFTTQALASAGMKHLASEAPTLPDSTFKTLSAKS